MQLPQQPELNTSPAAPSSLGAVDVLGYAGAAQILGTPLNTLYSTVARRQVPHFRYGPRHVRFSRAALQEWMAQRAIAPSAE